MSTPMVATRTPGLYARPTMRTIAVAALAVNALTFLFDMYINGPNDLNVPHVFIPLVVAGIAALRFRWAPAIGALLCAALLLEGYIFACQKLTEPQSQEQRT